MNYVGQRVRHKLFGEGLITEQDQENHISVCFSSGEVKQFSAPLCFQRFLLLINNESQQKAETDIQQRLLADQERAEKRKAEIQAKVLEKQVRIKSEASFNSIAVLPYASADAFFDDQEKYLLSEISYLRTNGGKRQKITDGQHVQIRNGVHVYSFESDSELNLPDNTQISLWKGTGAIPAIVADCEDFTLIITVSEYLGDYIPVIEFSAEPWRLLHFLIDRLKTLRGNNTPIAQALICNGRKQIQPGKPIQRGQDAACSMSVTQPITFIWGPPGTGKTETLANITVRHIAKGHRVLMLSYSNVSVDGAIERVFQKDRNPIPGKLVRYGYPRDKKLLQHEYLTTYNLALKNHPELVLERSGLMEERKRLPRTSPRYIDAGKRLTQIKNLLSAEEKRAVTQARFVATTVSKAIADKALYEDHFDTVIFDEASMAYIPQVIFAAGLAEKHFICMGDFSQLPPIVQSDSKSILNADIFQYCGIVNAVQEKCGHGWLCMLDIQHRMHPQIAAFSSEKMYFGQMISAADMLEKRQSIAAAAPFAREALALADISGMMSVCTKTADQSRINVLSAMITMGLAIRAATCYETGVITPYNAQARLLHAMSRDISEHCPHLHPITCATVHQFQGSEKDVIFYDAVDCYRMSHPGTLLTSLVNNYANRLYNVALTRARGKMVSVVNTDYMKQKKLSDKLIFRNLIDQYDQTAKEGLDVLREMDQALLSAAGDHSLDMDYLKDIENARREIRVDIPGDVGGDSSWHRLFTERINSARMKGIKVIIRAESKALLPTQIRPFAIENKYVANPVTLIDKQIAWFGCPPSKAQFISEGKPIATRFRPIIRFEGKHFAQALYGFLEMNQTVDQSKQTIEETQDGSYSSFASYVCGEIKCASCGSPMCLKKGKTGKFFLSCSNYPACNQTQLVDPSVLEGYFYFKNKNGMRCPQDHTSLSAGVGKYGIYVCCNGIKKHFFKLDEI